MVKSPPRKSTIASPTNSQPPTATNSSSFEFEGRKVHVTKSDGNQRKVTIELTGDIPSFEFEGTINGHDIRVIQRHLSTAYYAHLRQIRRLSTNQEIKGANDE